MEGEIDIVKIFCGRPFYLPERWEILEKDWNKTIRRSIKKYSWKRRQKLRLKLDEEPVSS